MDILIKLCCLLFCLLLVRAETDQIRLDGAITRIDNATGTRQLQTRLLVGEPLKENIEAANLTGDLKEFMYFYLDVWVGENPPRKQALIVDTGSSITAFPCQGVCESCGKHINSDNKIESKGNYSDSGASTSIAPYYPFKESKTYKKISCDKDLCLDCSKNEDCRFKQQYGEGSRYEGFYGIDTMRIGPPESKNGDFDMYFGCVTKETFNLQSQKADGVLGLSKSKAKRFPPINVQMREAKLVDSATFMVCLGMEDGIINFGGYDTNLLYNQEIGINWIPTIDDTSYSIQLNGLYVGNVHIPHVPKVGSIDTGASWVYMDHEEQRHIYEALDQFCKDTEGKCIGKKVDKNCHEYDTTMNKSLRDFFRSYPTITFDAGEYGVLNWFPSEYFSQQGDTNKFCISIEMARIRGTIVLGAAFLRQNLVVFDPESPAQIGFSRGKCSEYQHRVTTEVVNVTEGFYQVECHSCDFIKEETNIIILLAVTLIVVFLFAIVALTLGYVCQRVNRKDITYAQFTSEEDLYKQGHTREMENIGILNSQDDDEIDDSSLNQRV
ncbi:unnamed protein product [Moneuplotes crassus]|uniref:Peptidase A1 domain-containing protein n=2 Tax=Euplotes crassus TaxID=5936 RepID=A0AAD1X9W3_EUPCR|nr:unnamed protein product [Moneuplotes crassus]